MMSFYETGNGWLVLLSEDIYWASDKRLRNLSRFGLAVCTGMSHNLKRLHHLQGARGGQIEWTIPPSPEEFPGWELPADIRAALGQSVRQFEEDLRANRNNATAARAARLLLGFNLENPKAPFTALKRRWPWTRRAKRS